MYKRFLILIALLLLLPFVVDARQGCCSHHGGVCGCRCCDGSSLSSTCRPYYPSCNNPKPADTTGDTSLKRLNVAPAVETSLKRETTAPTINYNQPAALSENSDWNGGYVWLGLVIVGSSIALGYYFKKKK